VPFDQISCLEVVRVRREGKQRRLDEDLSQETATEAQEAAFEARRLGKLAKRVLREPLSAEEIYRELTAADPQRPRLGVFLSQLGKHELRHAGQVVSSNETVARAGSIEFQGAEVAQVTVKVAAANFGGKSASLEIESAPTDHQLLQIIYVKQAKPLEIAVANDSDLRFLCAAMTIEATVELSVIVDLKVTSKSFAPSARLTGVSNTQAVLKSLNEFLQRTLAARNEDSNSL
jgi:hypothetical protein